MQCAPFKLLAGRSLSIKIVRYFVHVTIKLVSLLEHLHVIQVLIFFEYTVFMTIEISTAREDDLPSVFALIKVYNRSQFNLSN